MKPAVGDGIGLIERSDKVALSGFVRIKRFDEGLSGRKQNKNEKQQERGNEEEDLAASSHAASVVEAPKASLQFPNKLDGPSFQVSTEAGWSLMLTMEPFAGTVQLQMGSAVVSTAPVGVPPTSRQHSPWRTKP